MSFDNEKKNHISTTTKSISSTDSDSIVDGSDNTRFPENEGVINRYVLNDAKLQTESGNIVTGDGEIILSKHFDSSDNNIFKDPQVAAYFADVYEKAEYECRTAFDPEFEWTQEEEKRVRRKIDFKVCGWACIMFIALQIDRGNISQAVADNMLGDLGLTTNQFNTGQTIFSLCFLAAELPSQLISKKVGPDRWIPMQITLWSIVAICQVGLSGKGSFYATRALLGFLEGGFIPDIVLWLSYFYTSKELPIRLSVFWTFFDVTQIFASLLAVGLLKMRGIHGMAGWRWLFLIEGILSFSIGISSFFMMPASPVETKTWFRKKGWFTEREEKIVVNKVLRDDPFKGDMHNREALTFRMLWNGICDYDLWPLYCIGIIAFIPGFTVNQYFTLTLKKLGFSTLKTNLLAVPFNFLHIFTLLGITRLSAFFKEKSLVSLIQPIWVLPCLFALRFWSGNGIDVWGTYAVLTILLAYPFIHPMVVAWTSANSSSVSTRTVSASIYNMCIQACQVIAANVYRDDDKPKYKRGNQNLIIINFLLMIVLLATKAYYLWRNKSRDNKWNSMSEQEKYEYLSTTEDKGNKRLNYRFTH